MLITHRPMGGAGRMGTTDWNDLEIDYVNIRCDAIPRFRVLSRLLVRCPAPNDPLTYHLR